MLQRRFRFVADNRKSSARLLSKLNLVLWQRAPRLYHRALKRLPRTRPRWGGGGSDPDSNVNVYSDCGPLVATVFDLVFPAGRSCG